MANVWNRLFSALICLLTLLMVCFFEPNNAVASKTVVVTPQPFSGIAPLEVVLTVQVAASSLTPKTYTMNFGDGSPSETVESDQFSHVFTHTYEEGFYRPVCTVQKTLGVAIASDAERVVVAKWRFETGGDIESSPAIGPDGTVYVGSDDNALYAIDPETGLEKWRFSTGSDVRSSPLIDSYGIIYVGSADGRLYAITEGGALKWSYTIGDYVYSSPAISADGRIVYVGASDHNLYAINAGSGTLKWTFTTGDKIISSPAIGHDGVEEVVYVGSLDRHVYALAAITGKLKWSFKTNAEVYASPAIDSSGRIFVGECQTGDAKEYNFKFYCINVDGSKLWEFNGGTGFYSSPAIGPNGLIYVGSWDGYLYALNSFDGTTSWSVRTSPPADLNSSPAVGIVVSEPLIYLGCKDGNFYAFESPAVEDDDIFGIKRADWVFQTKDDILSASPVIDANGTIYFGSTDNCLYAINPGNMTAADSDWPMFRSEPSHTGFTQNISIPAVISTSPGSIGETEVDINTKQIRVNFAPYIQTDQVQADSFKLLKVTQDAGNEEIDGYAVLDWTEYNNAGYHLAAVFTRQDDETPLDYNQEYQASITYTDAETEEEKIFSWSFTTAPKSEGSHSGSGHATCFIHTLLSD